MIEISNQILDLYESPGSLTSGPDSKQEIPADNNSMKQPMNQ